MYVDGRFECFTAELPQRGNEPNFSCIPPGHYTARYLKRSASGKYRDVYHLVSVPDRTGILIHAGNLAGDTKKGLKSHIQGCILIGTKLGVLGGQRAVLASRSALSALNQALSHQDFELTIIDHTGG